MGNETAKTPFVKVPRSFTRSGNELTKLTLSGSAEASLLYLTLLGNTADFNAGHFSVKLAADYAGCTENTVCKCLKELIAAGMVRAEKVPMKTCKGTGYRRWSVEVVDFDEVIANHVITSQVITSQVITSQVITSNDSLVRTSGIGRTASSDRTAPSTPSTGEQNSQKTTTAAPSAVSGGGASGGAGGAAEPSSDVLDDVYQEFAEKHREGEFDRFLRYNRQRGWSMGAYDAAHEWLSKERPDRSRKPKAAGSGERLPESVAGAMEQVRAMCGRLAGVNEALARKAAGWFKLAGICCTANPGNTKAPAKLMESAREFLRRCPLFLDGEDAGFGEFVD
ncbi:hypothetical protein, partial [Enterococcus faecium]|uniref:hypothetical protein n=1 Tax=Enterococcus faecium TaxID=1352 RepID=UPI003DA3DC97